MAASENQVAVPKSSAWLLERAQKAAEASGVGPEAVARVVQKTKEDAQNNSDDHQERMRLLNKKMTELRAKHEMNPFKNAEQPVATDIMVTPKVIKPPQQRGIKRKPPPTPTPVTKPANLESPAKKAKVQQKPHEVIPRKGKGDAAQNKAKVKVKAQQKQQNQNASKKTEDPKEQDDVAKLWKMRKQKDEPPFKDEPKSATFAESSTAGASREWTTATPANKPETTVVVPSNDLFVPEERTVKYPIGIKLPEWYTAINIKGPIVMAMLKRRPADFVALEALRNCLDQCEKSGKTLAELEKFFDTVRDYVHKAEIELQVTKPMLRRASMLSPDYGLPRIFKQGARRDYPWDLKADAYQLYRRWWKGDLNQDILRGIVSNKTDNRTSDRLDDTYRKQFATTAKYYGSGDLILGQWWPTQLCTVRDGAHGSAQGGIYGERDHGCYSIVLSGGNSYHDIDSGSTIEYSGTEGRNSTPTENTLHLVKSAELLNPIRVIRSAQLSKKNRYRPELGLRYDGLYVVRGFTLVDGEKAIYRFTLERCEGQEGIRWEGKGRRPTEYECEEYRRLKDKGVGVW